ncbi:hypothetical protein [Streptomyces sp. NPDC002133]|uniref:hypothetical protein n=1 Tax=Streptomyces sp. NPDC002133 TaxID=3154409 RepID=UPI00332DF0EA
MRVTVLAAADEPGGGCRSGELTLPGLIHDHCCAVHATGVASPFLSSLGLERYGLEWAWPEVDLAHPLDSGPPGVLLRSLDATATALGPVDGPAWRAVFAPLADGFDALLADIMRPIATHPPTPCTSRGTGSWPRCPRRCPPGDGAPMPAARCSPGSRRTASTPTAR